MKTLGDLTTAVQSSLGGRAVNETNVAAACEVVCESDSQLAAVYRRHAASDNFDDAKTTFLSILTAGIDPDVEHQSLGMGKYETRFMNSDGTG